MGDAETKFADAVLVQHFVLEHFSAYKQYVLKRRFFSFPMCSGMWFWCGLWWCCVWCALLVVFIFAALLCFALDVLLVCVPPVFALLSLCVRSAFALLLSAFALRLLYTRSAFALHSLRIRFASALCLPWWRSVRYLTLLPISCRLFLSLLSSARD
jgi:hypothetical protein